MAAEKKKILVTGASGFVGGALIGELRSARKFEIYGLVGAKNKLYNRQPSPQTTIFRGDISDYSSLELKNELKNIDVLVHTAGLAHQFGHAAREDFRRVNVKGTENICRLAHETGVRQMILVSSAAVYGDYKRAEINEDFECRPEGFYAESKLESEQVAIEICRQNRIPLTILRLATVIGEGDRGNTMRLITNLDKGRFIWIGKGTNKKSLIYKKDVAGGIIKTIEKPQRSGFEVYNLTAGAVSMKEVVETIARNLQKKPPRISIPEILPRGFFKLNKKSLSLKIIGRFESTFEKWLSNDIFSGDRFNEHFEYKPETPISVALEKQVNYYLDNKNTN